MVSCGREQHFSDAGGLREFVTGTKVEEHLVSSRRMKFVEDGSLEFNRVTLPLSTRGRKSLYDRLNIPAPFLDRTCDGEMREFVVNSLLPKKEQLLKVEVVEGRVEAVIPGKWLPVPNIHILHEIERFKGEVKEATFDAGTLRVILTGRNEVEAKSGDPFLFGYEVLNDETGIRRLEVSLFLHRIICANGLVGRDKVRSYSWHCSSRKPLWEIMDGVGSILVTPLDGETPVSLLQRAQQTSLGPFCVPLREFLKNVFELEEFEEEFSDLTEETSFYDVINGITRLARGYALERRRWYEIVAGDMLWGLSERGHKKRGFLRKLQCQSCTNDWRSAGFGGENLV